MKLRGFDGLARAIEERDRPKIGMGSMLAVETAYELERVTHVKPREARSIHQEVRPRAYTKRKAKPKAKDAPGGKYHPSAPAQLGWYLGRFYR